MYSRIIPGRLDRRGSRAAAAAFNGNFATLFPGAYQVLQTDRGLTYGGTMLAAGTTPPVITLTGSLSGAPVPITVTDVLPGVLGAWTGQVSYDGGATQAQSFTSAATVPLTGAGAGLTLNIAAGAALGDNVWTATCASLADQSANGMDAVQVTAASQPVVMPGLNGKASLLFDGVDDFLLTSALNLPLTTVMWIVFKCVASGSFKYVLDSSVLGNRLAFYEASGGIVSVQNGAQLDGALAVGAWGRVAGTWDLAGTIKAGSNPVVNGSSGASTSAGAGRLIGKTAGGSQSNIEFLALAYAPAGTALTVADSAINSSGGYGVGNVLI